MNMRLFVDSGLFYGEHGGESFALLCKNGADLDARTAKGASVEIYVGGANASTINKMLRDAKKKK